MAARAKGTRQARKPRGPAQAAPKAPAPPEPQGGPKAPPEPQSGPKAPPEAQAAPEGAPAARRPVALRLAAAAQLTEAAGLCVAAVFAAINTADGHSYQLASGIALTLIAFGAAAGLAVIAVALAKARPWSRTPTAMTQLFGIIAGVTLLEGNRPEWGLPALILAVVCLGGLLTPASLRALNRS